MSTSDRGLSRRDVLRFAAAAPLGASMLRWVPSGEDRCVVVVELVGGNDGLNTLIPLDNDVYRKARPTLSSVAADALKIDRGFGLHPSMPQLRELFDRGEAAAVHSVGYPNPDRSHFRSRDIWHSGDPDLVKVKSDTTGWLGRAADCLQARGTEVPALGLGGLEVPLMLEGRDVVAPVLRRIEDYALLVDPRGDERRRREGMSQMVGGSHGDDDLIEFVQGVAQSGVEHASSMRKALAGYRAKAEYPQSDFGRALQLTARVLVSGFGTRLCHVPMDGYDTHARQAPTHAGLMRQLSLGLGALCADLRAHGELNRVTILVHSEFGRRVAENKSQGTDHGAAAPVFLIGGGIKPGLHGTPPDFDDLDDGDIKASTDFRVVYAAIAKRIGVPVDRVVGATAKPADLF